MGRCIGPSKNEGNEIAQWVLKNIGKIVPQLTIRKLTQDELVRESEIKKRDGFDAEIKIRYGDFSPCQLELELRESLKRNMKHLTHLLMR